MAEWKKVVVSGSGVAQLSNDANYLIDAQDGAQLSGSFTGSFVGDGSGLTGVTADGTISGSVQVTVQDTTGFSGLQANISSSITSLSSSVDAHLDANISALSASVDTHLDANISALSASAHADRVNKISVLSASVDTHLDSNISSLSSSAEVKREAISSSFATTGAAQDSRLTAIEAFTGSLDDTFATEAELHTATASLSASAHTDRVAKIAILSASVDAHLDANISALSSSVDTHLDANIAALSASAHSQRVSEDTVLSGSAHTDRIAKVAILSGSAHTDRVAKVAVLSGSAHTARRSEISALSASVDTHLDSNISALSSSAHTDRVAKVAILSASAATALASQGNDVTDLAASQSAFDTAFTLDGQNVTVAGNLEVSGTTTTVNSTTVEFSDNIISLNGTGAANGGIEVHDANGPASGSLLWDGTNNRWIAGGKGTETAVFTSGGDHDLVSGSSQVTISSTTGYTAYSASVQTYTDAVVAALSASADTHLDANISALSSSAHSQRVSQDTVLSGSAHTDRVAKVAALSASVDTHLDANISALSASADSQRNAISGALASTIANISSTTLTNGSFEVEVDSTNGELVFTEGQRIGDKYDQGAGTLDLFAPSGAAHIELNYGDQDFIYLDGRKAGIQLETDGTTIEWTFYGNNGQLDAPGNITVPANSSVSGGAGNFTTLTGSLNFDQLVSVPAGIISSSAQTVAALDNQHTDFGTGAITASGYSGDGSGLSNLTVTQNATIDDSFTSVTSYTVTHNFNSKNVIVQVYDTDDEMIVPASVDTTNPNTAVIDFGETFSGRAVVARGGHIVSGSIPFANLLEVPTLISGSSQVTISSTTGYTAYSQSVQTYTDAVVAALSASVDTHLDANISALSASVDTHLDANISALSASVDTHLDANISALSASAHTARGTIDSSFTLSADIGTNDNFTTGNTLTFAGTANEIVTTVSDDQIQIGLPDNVTIGGALTVTGDLTVTGNTTEQQVTNLNVEDQFILINSGGVAQDAGFVVNGQGAAFGWDESENRFALDFSGATWNQTAISSDAYVAAVVTSDNVNYQKVGNIRIDSDDIYIYV